MIVTIELRYMDFENDETLRRASFNADSFEFEVNPNREAARLAFNWLNQIARENPFLSRITKAVYNDRVDITSLVQELWHKDMRKVFEEW